MCRETIFISHALLPKDNEFVLWLASRLQMMGYKVWCDLIKLKGGEEDFWGKVIEPQIRNEAIKFILVVSKAGIVRQGVIDEFSFARDIAKENNLKDFVIPIRIEDVPFTSRIGINTYNVIDCSENWQKALTSLVEIFQLDSVPKVNNAGLSDMFKNIINPKEKVYEKNEYYYSSWIKPVNLPQTFFLFQYETDEQANAIAKNYHFEYPVIRHGNYLVSFNDEIQFNSTRNISELDLDNADVLPKRVQEINFNHIVPNVTSQFPTTKDIHYLLKRLLNHSFLLLMLKRGVKKRKMSNNRFCYYFPLNYRSNNKTIVKYPNRIKKKNLVGRYFDDYWHFGISFNALVVPSLYYNIKSHILFSTNGHDIWQSDSKLHSARRKKGRSWYNEHWRDQTMAFFAYLKKDSELTHLSYPISKQFNLNLPLFTEYYISNFGYDEPTSKDRMDIINKEEEFVEMSEEINVE